MELPIYIDGKQEGTIFLEKRGAVTLIRADMRDVGRVVRLNLYGDGAGYLGVPAPEEGRLRLVKRLSPLDMKKLPARPEYAAERPMGAHRETDELPREDTPPAARHVVWQGGKPYYF